MEVIAAGRAKLIRQHRDGQIEDETLHDLERDLDLEEIAVIFQRGPDGESGPGDPGPK